MGIQRRIALFATTALLGAWCNGAGVKAQDSYAWMMAPLPGAHTPQPVVLKALVPRSDNRFVPAGATGLERVKNYSMLVGVRLLTPLDSEKNVPGDRVAGVLTDDLRIGGILVARKNSTVLGEVVSVEGARTFAQSVHDQTRRWKSRGCMGIVFKEIQDDKGNRIGCKGTLTHQTNSTNDGHRELRVDRLGRIIKSEDTLSENKRHVATALRFVQAIPIPGTIVLNVFGPSVAMAAIGAIDPELIYNKPMDKHAPGVRKKAAVYAFWSNLPGVAVYQAFTEKGGASIVRPGDQVVVNFQIGDVIHESTETMAKLLPSAQNGFAADLAGQRRFLITPQNGGKRLLPGPPTASTTADTDAATASKQVKAVIIPGS